MDSPAPTEFQQQLLQLATDTAHQVVAIAATMGVLVAIIAGVVLVRGVAVR